MGCSCCSNEINKENSFFSKRIKKKKSNNYNNNNNNNIPQLRIDSIGSVNSINFNGVYF